MLCAFRDRAFRFERLEHVQHIADVDMHDLDVHSGANRAMLQQIRIGGPNAVLVVHGFRVGRGRRRFNAIEAL
jgi:hypothetical protein